MARVPSLLCALLIVYLAYHAVQGERGLIAYYQLYQQVGQANTFHASLKASRERLQTRVNLLIPSSLDRDMLDERARFMLGYSHPDEVIILVGNSRAFPKKNESNRP